MKVRLDEVLQILASGARDPLQKSAAGDLLREAKSCAPASVRKEFREISEASIDDAIAELAIKALAGTARFNGTTPSQACAWCMQVVRNVIRDNLRRQRRFVPQRHRLSGQFPGNEDDLPPSEERVLPDQMTPLYYEDLMRVWDRVRELVGQGPNRRTKLMKIEVLMAHKVEGLSPRALSDTFNVKPDVIYQWLHRARKHAADALTEIAGETPELIEVIDELAPHLDIRRSDAQPNKEVKYELDPRRQGRGATSEGSSE